MNKYICDDRLDVSELMRKIDNMTDEEFEEYCEELKKEEQERKEKQG